jgi:hypothetical protein
LRLILILAPAVLTGTLFGVFTGQVIQSIRTGRNRFRFTDLAIGFLATLLCDILPLAAFRFGIRVPPPFDFFLRNAFFLGIAMSIFAVWMSYRLRAFRD